MTGRKAGVALDFVLQAGRVLYIAKANCTEGPKGRSVLRQREKDKTEDSQAAFPKSSSLCAEIISGDQPTHAPQGMVCSRKGYLLV